MRAVRGSAASPLRKTASGGSAPARNEVGVARLALHASSRTWVCPQSDAAVSRSAPRETAACEPELAPRELPTSSRARHAIGVSQRGRSPRRRRRRCCPSLSRCCRVAVAMLATPLLQLSQLTSQSNQLHEARRTLRLAAHPFAIFSVSEYQSPAALRTAMHVAVQ